MKRVFPKSLDNFFSANQDYVYFIFRVFVGALFLQHGAQKLLGYFGGVGGGKVELMSQMGAAGVIEFFGGLFIILGLFTQLSALIAALEMLVAFYIVHVPNGWIPIVNRGELALLYFAAFLALIIFGGRKWSFDEYILKKK